MNDNEYKKIKILNFFTNKIKEKIKQFFIKYKNINYELNDEEILEESDYLYYNNIDNLIYYLILKAHYNNNETISFFPIFILVPLTLDEINLLIDNKCIEIRENN